MRLHAHEITVLHGLKLDEPVPLGRGAYLASYDAVRKRFGLPEEPEPWLRRSDEGLDLHPGRLARASSRAVLVRQVSWGPAVAPCDCSTNPKGSVKLRYRFPDDHRVESVADVFEERETLLKLLSIAVRSKLVSHTVIDAVPPWMTLIDPNLRTGSPGGGRGVFDVWPKDRAPSMRDLNAFSAAARGWLTFCAGKGDRSTELAVRRTAASFGIAGGRFGVEDRLIDASIALEAMYGPFDNDITRKNQLARGLATRRVRCRGRHLQGNEILLQGPLQGCPRNRRHGQPKTRARARRRSRIGTRTRAPYAIRLARSRSGQRRERMGRARAGGSERRERPVASQSLHVFQHM